MSGLDIEVEVPESRQVTITLPPDAPVGRVRLLVCVADPGPTRRFVAEYDPNKTVCYSGQVVVLPDGGPG